MNNPCLKCGNRHRDKLTPPCAGCLEFVRYQILEFPDPVMRRRKRR